MCYPLVLTNIIWISKQPYLSFNDACKLGLKVERQLNEAKSKSRDGFERSWGFEPTIQSKVVPKEQVKSDGANGTKQQQPTSNPRGRKYFKCHGFGHIASDCPNKKVVDLVEK